MKYLVERRRTAAIAGKSFAYGFLKYLSNGKNIVVNDMYSKSRQIKVGGYSQSIVERSQEVKNVRRTIMQVDQETAI